MANEFMQTPAIEADGNGAPRCVMSPQKVRLVVDLIRGQRAEDALQILRFTKKRATRDVEKVLRSAIANAERKAGRRRGLCLTWIICSCRVVL